MILSKKEKMRRILLTGVHGFIGSNIKDYIGQRYTLFAPDRYELNLLDEIAVKKYIIANKIDIIVHLANPNPVKNSVDKSELLFSDSLRMFMNLYNARDYYEYMFTLGSGAEYDKRNELKLVKENEVGKSLPIDEYGFAKYIINQIVRKSDKHCNLRVFACYGPGDHESKFITHVIKCCKDDESITIRQDCYFDYMHVNDLARIICYFIDNKPIYRDYNICTGNRILLSEIAGLVRKIMKKNNEIIFLKDGFNKEYTGDNSRLLEEIKGFRFTDIVEGIEMQIESELS